MTEETTLAERLKAMPPGKIEVFSRPEPITPKQEIAYASEIARELNTIIDKQKLYSYISNKKYVAVEGWTTLAALRGCTPRETSNAIDPNRDGVYIATVELVNAQGRVIGRASAECGDPDEVDRKGKPVWASRPAYARRSMANTRATSKVCRQVFSWIMVLAGYAATPAEEVPAEGFKDAPTQAKTGQEGASKPSGDSQSWDGTKEVFFGKYSKPPPDGEGPKMWGELPGKYLEWVVENMKPPASSMAAQEMARRAREESNVVEGEVVEDGYGKSSHDDDGPEQSGLPMEGPPPDDPRFR